MKKLKILFYLTVAFLLTVCITSANKKVFAQDKLPGYSEWSTEKTGEEGEISGTLYSYKEAASFSSEGSETKPSDGFYTSSTTYKITEWTSCGCTWRKDIYHLKDTGIKCWNDDEGGLNTWGCTGKAVRYSDSKSCEGVCSADETTLYYPVNGWSEEKGFRMDEPYEKTSTINPIQTTVYCHPLTFTVTLDDGQVIKIKHGETLPSITIPTKQGYIFKGFYDAEGKQFYDEKGYTSVVYEEGMSTSLIAKWVPITYTVKYLSDNSSGSTASQTLKYDEYSNVKECGYSKSGYSFAYWQDDYGKMYSPGDTIYNLVSVNNGVYSLHAVWKKDQEIIVNPPKDDDTKKDDTNNNSTNKDGALNSKTKKITTDSLINKSDLSSENYYLIKVPKELTIDNNIDTINFEVKGKLKDGSSLKIELPNTLYLKTSDFIDYEMNLNNIDAINANELNEVFKEISISLNQPFNDGDKYNISFPLTISVINKDAT